MLAVAAVFGLGGGRLARAASPREQAKAAVEEAEVQYKLGRFQKALEGYARAYELFPAPALLFDIGQCHRQLKDWERAIFFFEGYLREETNPARRRLAQDLVAAARAELDKQRAEARAAPPSSTSASDATTTTPPAATTPVEPQAATQPPPAVPAPSAPSSPALVATPSAPDEPPPAARSKPITERWWFWTALGVGLLAVGGGVAYALSGTTTTVLPSGSAGTLDRR
jgi:hypothetical protein